MTVLRLRFPLGRYHANPWDRHVNEGVTEWPPSPWRVARALYSVWRERCPDLEEADVASAIDLVAVPPVYRLPPALAASTHHYYKDSGYVPGTGVGSKPTRILDGFMALPHGGHLDLVWETPGSSAAVSALAVLARGLPYIGRADSICEGEVVDDGAPHDEYETLRPQVDGDLLLPTPARPVDLATLTVTTEELRKRRLSRPPGADWVAYPSPRSFDRALVRAAAPWAQAPDRVEAVLLAVRGRPAPAVGLGVAVADAVSRAAQSRFGRLCDGSASTVLSGHVPGSEQLRRDQHQHAHWAPLEGADGRVDRVLVWAPEGLPSREVAALGSLSEVRPQTRLGQGGAPTVVVRGLTTFRLTLARAGRAMEVVPELAPPAPSVTWESVTPFVPSRHQKKRHGSDGWIGPFTAKFIEEEVARELAFRDLPPARVSEAPSPTGRPTQAYRRYRRRLAEARPGVWLRLSFDEPVSGPLLLGYLSHFGLGLFRPSQLSNR